jgi:Tol biopolymer transport system component
MTQAHASLFALIVALPAMLGSVTPPTRHGCASLPERTERVDVSTAGEQANGPTFRGPMSASGRVVAFSSDATNLVPGDYNGVEDVFVRDRMLNRTVRVSVSSAGEEANGPSYLPLLSGDGRVVAFRSTATNLAGRDSHRVESFFVHDLLTGRTRLVGLGPTGVNPSRPLNNSRRAVCDRWCVNAISADGGALVFTSSAAHLLPGDGNGVADVFVEAAGRTYLISRNGDESTNGRSEGSSVSADGRVVAFRSFASNLVPGDSNRVPDVFVRDRLTGDVERVSVASSGAQAGRESFRGMVSADGRFVGFRSSAGNLVPRDTNGAIDVFVHDRLTGTTTRISVASDGAQAEARWFPKAVRNSSLQSRPFLSRHGRYAAFTSRAPNLVPGDTNGHADVFWHDLETGRTVRVSVPDRGGQAISDSRVTGISADGTIVGFMSPASNLVPRDTNQRSDYFIRVLAVCDGGSRFESG